MGLFSVLDTAKKVKFKKLKEDGCLVSISVEIPAAHVEDETQNFLVRIQQRARVPGFRPGKAPLDLVKKQFIGHAREEALDHLIRKHVPEALRELRIRPVVAPAVEDVSFEEGKPLRLQVRAETAPAVSPKDYLKIKVQRKAYPATEEALQARLEELREANARLERAEEEAVAVQHYAVIDYEGLQDGKPMANVKGRSELVDLSSDQILEGLAAGLLGLKRGQTKQIPVKLGGKDVTLSATLREIKRKVLPALDAEFAKDLGFGALDELKAKLKEVIESEGRGKTEKEVSQQIEEALLKSNQIPLPPSLAEAQLEHRMEQLRRQLMGPKGQWPAGQLEDLKAKLRPQAENELRLSYILPAIAEKEKLQVLDDEVQAELDKNLAAAESEEKKADIRKFFSDRKEAVVGMISERKTLAFIKEKAVYTEVKA
ncbi:MAG: trigger factor [Elusimicrobia bacterium]|nr:trigger factor [Elusimicrobiota bacterium]